MEDIDIRIIRERDYRGFYKCEGTNHTIEISSHCTRCLDSLLKVTAHEIIHLKQQLHCEGTSSEDHNKEFWIQGKIICALMGWDFGLF